MSTLYVLCLVGVISLGFALPTGIDNQEQNIQLNNNTDAFNPNNITVQVVTNWTSNLNITGVSQSNDPNEKLITFVNVSQSIHAPGNGSNVVLSIKKLDFVDIYTKDFNFTYNEVRTGWKIENGSVHVNASLGVVESFQRTVDFSNFDKRSYIYYNVTFISIVNITFPANFTTDTTVEEIEAKYPELKTIEMPQVESNSTRTPLVNSTGDDVTVCSNKICSSSTKSQKDMETFYLFDNINVINSREVTTTASGFFGHTENDTLIYSSISHININYEVVIGEHRCYYYY